LSPSSAQERLTDVAIVLRIPTLAIHLERKETFDFNKETQLFPIAGLVSAELNRTKDQVVDASKDDGAKKSIKAATERHHPYLVELIASEIDAKPSEILDFELILFDTQKSCLGGMLEEFVYSPRLDNLEMSFCSVRGLIESVRSETAVDNDSAIRLIALFDHEEVGSTSAQGADSNTLPAIIRRLSVLPAEDFGSEKSYNKVGNDLDISTAFEQSLSTSFLLSADMAHSVHPNYSHKYEADHKPHLNEGPVVKINANQRYATNSPGIVLLQEIAEKAAEDGGDVVPLQLFVVRNDSSCGSTIGPMLSSNLGTRTLDLGNPQLSMHSCRETGGTQDIGHAIRLFSSFFDHYSTLAPTIFVD
jgi:aspartyl aminopeptidase